MNSSARKMMKIEQVVVGSDGKPAPKEIKKEIVVGPVQSYQHENLQCFLCFITFCNSKAKERHMRKSHRELYKMQLQETDTIFTCYQCDKSFSSSELLSAHQATHSKEEKPFRCGYCQKHFLTYTEVNKHRRLDCIERRFPCQDCGALFPSPARARHHRATTHSQGAVVAESTNTYQCCKCSGSFNTEEDLLLHQEKFANSVNCDLKPPSKKRGRKPKSTAQGGIVDSKKIKLELEEGYIDSTSEGCQSDEQKTELQIPCPEESCDLMFSSVTALRAHKRGDHGPSSNKPHTCTECDASYAQPEQLQAHMSKAHCSEYTCPTCGESFVSEGHLKIHQDTHTEGEEGAKNR